MVRRVRPTQRSIAIAAQAAREHNCAVEIVCPDGVRFSFSPLPIEERELRAVGKVSAHPRPTPATRAHNSRDDMSAAEQMADYHKPIGFDPKTMSEAGLPRLYQEAHARELAKVPGTKLNGRERNALAQLVQHGVGVPVATAQVKDCGAVTEERLVVRGFIETRPRDNFPDRVGCYILTAAGLAAHEVAAGDQGLR